jgi:hypothetical protein
MEDLGQSAVHDMVELRRVWETLSLLVSNATWKKKQSREASPKPELEELLKHFRPSFMQYMLAVYCLPELMSFETLGEFKRRLEAKELDGKTYLTAIIALKNEYLNPLSSNFVNCDPGEVSIVEQCILDADFDLDKYNETIGLVTNSETGASHCTQYLGEDVHQ